MDENKQTNTVSLVLLLIFEIWSKASMDERFYSLCKLAWMFLGFTPTTAYIATSSVKQLIAVVHW